jgi:hypothetical protein
MKNLILSALSAGLLFASAPATPASAAVHANINLNFGAAPQVYFARPPREILIPDTPVYYVEGTGYDMFQLDGIWYVDNNGYWFDAPSYEGPFTPIDFYSVPSVIVNVPSAYAHEPYRPGVWRQDARSYGYGGGYGRTYVNTRQWQNSDQRWQQRQRVVPAQPQRVVPAQPQQQRVPGDRGMWTRTTQRGQQQQSNGRGHDNGNGNNGNHGNGNGHGRGHDRNNH